MKRSPRIDKIEQIMRSQQLVADGFLGDDSRTLEEIIESDQAALEQCGITAGELADKMAYVSRHATTGLGNFVSVSEFLSASCDDNRGQLACPWGDGVRKFKTVTTAVRTDTRLSVQWSDLSIHMVGEHGFFEGRGSAFRLEPAKLAELLEVVDIS